MSEHLERLKTALADRYVIDREIGRGGMAVVYLAEDVKHARQVAIKVLQPSLSATLGTDRFLREIETAARLNHPHILPLYDSGEADGFLYYVMPYVEGDSLRDRIDRECQLQVEEAVRLTREVAGGLGYAHSEGVIHRDIKPGNIMLSQGHAVIADFGIAQAVDEAGGEKLTHTGVSTGSPVYMSPEQARGSERLDGRTDVYSLGCVLYEMLAGEPPFTGGTQASITARKEMESAPSLRTLRDTVPEGVEGAVARALAKVPADRFGSAEAFTAALGASTSQALSKPSRRERRPFPKVAFALVVVLALVGLLTVFQSQNRGPTTTDAGAEDTRPAIAVLPFTVRGEGLDVWRQGMVDVLSTNLEGVPGLRTIPSNDVLARWSRETPSDELADLQTTLSVAAQAGARYAVMGKVLATGSSLRFDADLYDVPAAEILYQARAEGAADDALSLVDELSIEIIGAIGAGETSEIPKFDLAGSMSPSLDAVKAYLEGEANFRRSDFESAAESYESAIEADSTFALALYRAVDAYGWADGAMGPRVNGAAERARRLIEKSPSDLPLPIRIQLSRGLETRRLAERAVREHPDDARLWDILGESYGHRGAELLDEPGSEGQAMARAIALDSGLTRSYGHLLNTEYRLEPDSARIADLIDRYEAHGAAPDVVEWERVSHAIAFGDSAARRRAYSALDSSAIPLTPAAMARWNLSHPLFLPQRAEVFRIASRRKNDHLEPQFSDWLVVRTALDRGRIAEAAEEVRSRELQEGLRLPLLYRAYSQGLPVPTSLVDSVLGVTVPDTVMCGQGCYEAFLDGGTRMPFFYTAAYAAMTGSPRAAAEAATRLRAAAEYHREAGDTIRAKIASGAAKALAGLDAWKNGGDYGEARRLLDDARTTELLSQWEENRVVRWWLGELLAESGDLESAIPYYLSLTTGTPSGLYDPPAMYRLGQVYEQLGEVENAREAYAWVLLAWRDADESMVPWVSEIEQRLLGLGADIGSQ